MRPLSRSIITVSIVIMVAAPAGPSLGGPGPPGFPTTLQVLGDGGGGCGLSTVPDAVHPLGGTVRMWNGSDTSATIFQRDGFWTKTLAIGAEKFQEVFGAGTYLSACVPGQWEAPIKVLPRAPGAPSTNSFKVTWADDAAPATWRYGVQYRIGQGVWKVWKSGTAQRSATFNGLNGKTYFFKARTNRPAADEKTDWSPLRKVVT
jgi:hypothetical protein